MEADDGGSRTKALGYPATKDVVALPAANKKGFEPNDINSLQMPGGSYQTYIDSMLEASISTLAGSSDTKSYSTALTPGDINAFTTKAKDSFAIPEKLAPAQTNYVPEVQNGYETELQEMCQRIYNDELAVKELAENRPLVKDKFDMTAFDIVRAAANEEQFTNRQGDSTGYSRVDVTRVPVKKATKAHFTQMPTVALEEASGHDVERVPLRKAQREVPYTGVWRSGVMLRRNVDEAANLAVGRMHGALSAGQPLDFVQSVPVRGHALNDRREKLGVNFMAPRNDDWVDVSPYSMYMQKNE